MTIERTEETLTAYAMGELNQEQTEQVEAWLAEDDQARESLKEIRAVASLLSGELESSPAARLDDQRRAHVEGTVGGNSRTRPSRLRWWVPTAVAAVLLVAVSAVLMFGGFYGDSGDPLAISSTSTETPTEDRPDDGLSGGQASKQPSGGPNRTVSEKRNSRPVQSEVMYKKVRTPHGASGHTGGVRGRPVPMRPEDGWNREGYDHQEENDFRTVKEHPLSTFSIDVDTASYSNVRRLLNQGTWPPKGAVRIEEMINYFSYDYATPAPGDERPFAVHASLASCPWNPTHRLARIGIKGKEIKRENRPPSNVVFLLDVSGSMRSANKLPLVKHALGLLVERLNENDRVAIVVYAGASGLVLDSTTGDKRDVILSAMDQLAAGGSTNGGAGIELAYKVAGENFIKGGTNRVILCTDGDFNVGTTSRSSLVDLIKDKAKSGVFLSVLGFGMGNYQDGTLESLADKGNGNYAYIDNRHEARKVLVEQMTGTLITIAKDVKIQVEFNPVEVAGYRLIGYENRMLKKEDFNDDKKDAGEIGAGHTVTALYEIVPAGETVPSAKVDDLKYQTPSKHTDAARNGEALTVKLRYKEPDGEKSRLIRFAVRDEGQSLGRSDKDFRFAVAVASFGMILRDSEHKGSYTLEAAAELARTALGSDDQGRRAELVKLIGKASGMRAGHLAEDTPSAE